MVQPKEQVFPTARSEHKERGSDLDGAARVLSTGGVVLCDLFPTPGLMVDGTNPQAIAKLRQIKRVTPDRPFVSTAQLQEVPKLIDIKAHTALIQPYLQRLENLLHPDGHPIFYRFYANPTLKPPLVASQNGAKLIVILVHNDRALNFLFDRGKRYKQILCVPAADQPIDFLLTGSSANPSGAPAPISIETIDEQVRQSVDFILTIGNQPLPAGPVPIVDLTGSSPYCLRQGAYDVTAWIEMLTYQR